MVTLSRRGARKSNKRGRSKRSLKGGKYDGPNKTYNRIDSDSTLYRLSITEDSSSNKIYTLDFSYAEGKRLSGVSRLTSITDKYSSIASGMINSHMANKYSDAFIKAFCITGMDNIKSIQDIIGMLFAEGVDGAKQRKLIITEKSDSVEIELKNNESTENTTIVKKTTFEDYLRSLGDGLMPVTTALVPNDYEN